jgi:DNA-binding beta-propeller fold protein YncE
MKKAYLLLTAILLLVYTSDGISGTGTAFGPIKNSTMSESSSYYSSIQKAYNEASGGNPLLLQEVYFIEDVNLNRDIATTLLGGYDSSFVTASGSTVIYGKVTISGGTVTMSNVTIGNPSSSWTCTDIALTSTPKYTESPVGVIFDGTHIWVATENGQRVYKILASSGEVVKVYHSGPGAQYLAFDNVNKKIWITNAAPVTNYVTVIDAASDDLKTYASGTMPDGIAFDGANMWVANYDPATVTKIRASDGAILLSIPVGTYGSSKPRFVAYDDVARQIWVTIGTDDKVKKINVDTGEIVGDYDVPGFPYAIVFDGAYMWITRGDGTVVKIHPGDGTIAGTYNAGFAPNGIAFGGTYLWITDQLGMVHQLSASDGAHIGTYRTGKRPQWVTLGEGYVWITNGDDDTVSRCTY